jgi:acyl transferase domain-containing protein
VNAPRHVVLAGPVKPLEQVTRELRAAGMMVVPVPAFTAFHSPMLAGAAADSMPVIAKVRAHLPRARFWSAYTAAPLTEAQIADPGYWASHPIAPVLFWQALDGLLSEEIGYTLIETGPGHRLSTIARRHPSVCSGRHQVLAALPTPSSRHKLRERESLEILAERLITLASR